ncbi:hypothetical protein C8Q78DRAFT_1124830 [Trametes maxima]|nr:hypothetical protein C8Q78DRAFT_1124830 [Trametes maxima]
MDEFGIVYIIETAQQFWSELEDILHLPDDSTLSKLDSTLRRYISFCAAYHEQYLQSPLQLEHACNTLLDSELFTFHNERMCELLVLDAQTSTDPHYEMILYHVMLSYGRRKPPFLRSQKHWQPLLPLLIDHVRLEIDPDVDDSFYGTTAGPSSVTGKSVAVPIEAKLRTLSVRMLYEVCRVQKMSLKELRIFDDSFIDYLFDLVEQTRDQHDETFNYSVIKLIVSGTSFFTRVLLPPESPKEPMPRQTPRPEGTNRVLGVLMARLRYSPTFGENLIFMLNRADRTAEDLCMQLLVLKLLYLLFTTKGMSEYFYTNDLCVLVDVFLREIGDIDEENESLRHTYLRVLHPLLTKTQLRDRPYKRPQIVRTLESLVENESIRDIDPTTKRLVARCLGGEWCVQFRKENPANAEQRKFSMWEDDVRRGESPGLDAVSSAPAPHSAGPTTGSGGASAQLERMGSLRGKHGKASRSAEHLPLPTTSSSSVSRTNHAPHHTRTDEQPPYKVSSRAVPPPSPGLRHGSGDSSSSLPRVATAAAHPNTAALKHRHRAGSFDVEGMATTATMTTSLAAPPRALPHILDDASPLVDEPTGVSPPEIRVLSPTSPGQTTPPSPVSTSSSGSTVSGSTAASPSSRRRPPPPPPPVVGRRKPPPVPTRRTLGPSPLGALASSSQPNLAALSAGVRKASGGF